MGAFDSWSGTAACPRCGLVHHCDGQTGFLAPDFGGLTGRWLRPEVAVPIDFAPVVLQGEVWDHYEDYLRVRAPSPGPITLLIDRDELFACPCGEPLATVLLLDFTPGDHVVLQQLQLRPALAPEATDVDFVNAEWVIPWEGDYGQLRAGMVSFAALDPPRRRARLHEALRERFPEGWDEGNDTWLSVKAPAVCTSCGVVRELRVDVLANHPQFEVPWFLQGRTGVLQHAERTPDDGLWHTDTDHHFCLRTRPPVGPDELVLLQPMLHGLHCPCVSEPQWARLQWIATEGWVALAEVQLVPQPDRAALVAVDFVYAPGCVPGPPDAPFPPTPPASREEALARFLADLT